MTCECGHLIQVHEHEDDVSYCLGDKGCQCREFRLKTWTEVETIPSDSTWESPSEMQTGIELPLLGPYRFVVWRLIRRSDSGGYLYELRRIPPAGVETGAL